MFHHVRWVVSVTVLCMLALCLVREAPLSAQTVVKPQLGLDAVSDPLTLTASSSLWHTFLGGAGFENIQSVAVDANGNVYAVGYSDVSWGEGECAGCPIRQMNGDDPEHPIYDAFVAKLNPNGELVWNTFLGGIGTDIGYSVGIDQNGNVYLGGYSNVTWGGGECGGCPLRPHSGQNPQNPVNDAFVVKLNSSGAMLWNTFLGGNLNDQGLALVVDAGGNSFLAGISGTTWGTPIRSFSAGGDGFVVKLDTHGALQWNTFLGGSGGDNGASIARDGNGNLYIGGASNDTWGSPVRPLSSGFGDAFAAKLNSNGVLVWNTFLGGSGADDGEGIGVDVGGNVYLGGRSMVAWGSGECAGCPIRPFTTGVQDVYVAKLNSNGLLTWNTFLGGSGYEYGYDLAVGGDRVYVTGMGNTTWGNPTHGFSGAVDAFVATLDVGGGLVANTFLGGIADDHGNGLAIANNGIVYLGGMSKELWGVPSREFTWASDGLVVKMGDPSTYTPCAYQKPAKPSLKSPEYGFTTNKRRPTLKWDPAECVATYRATVKDAATGQNVAKAPGLKVRRFKPEPLPDGVYNWFVKACNPNGCRRSLKYEFTIAP